MDHPTAEQPKQENTGKFMDVQPPTGQQMPGTSDVRLNGQTRPTETKEGPTGQQPTQQIPVADSVLPTQSQRDLQPPQSDIPAEQPKIDPRMPKNPSKAPILAIIIAILVAGGLTAAAIFLYIQNNDSTIKREAAAPQQSQNAPTVQETTPQQDVSDSVDELDKSLKEIDSSSGADSEEISDDKLGL